MGISCTFMRLSVLASGSPAGLIRRLEECGIRTDYDLLFSGSPIELYHHIQPIDLPLHELTQFITLVSDRAAAPAMRGDALLLEAQGQSKEEENMDTGVVELDALLEGFGRSRVIEVSGDKGSGKTVGIIFPRMRCFFFLTRYENARLLRTISRSGSWPRTHVRARSGSTLRATCHLMA